jgi:AraC family transcriptional regulator
MELAAGAQPGPGQAEVTLPGGTWARFVVADGIEVMPEVWAEIHGHWLKQPDWQPRPGPSVEFYPPAFNGATGQGGYEIWVPVA